MRKLLTAFICLTIALISESALARDDKHMYSIKEAMELESFKEKLDPAVRFYFGTQKSPAYSKKYGTFSSNKKTNAFGKSDEKACNWAFLSALLSLQARTLNEGGNAVINIKSNYKKNEVSDNNNYECHAGNIMAGVALKGTVVKLK